MDMLGIFSRCVRTIAMCLKKNQSSGESVDNRFWHYCLILPCIVKDYVPRENHLKLYPHIKPPSLNRVDMSVKVVCWWNICIVKQRTWEEKVIFLLVYSYFKCISIYMYGLGIRPRADTWTLFCCLKYRRRWERLPLLNCLIIIYFLRARTHRLRRGANIPIALSGSRLSYMLEWLSNIFFTYLLLRFQHYFALIANFSNVSNDNTTEKCFWSVSEVSERTGILMAKSNWGELSVFIYIIFNYWVELLASWHEKCEREDQTLLQVYELGGRLQWR